jgi:hypothetical protein
MRRGNSIIKAKCDYILGSERGLFTMIAIHNPIYYSSDHYMVMGTIASRPKRENKYDSRSRKSFPLTRDKVTPINKADSIFDEINPSWRRMLGPHAGGRVGSHQRRGNS